jgi:hypothetical protein
MKLHYLALIGGAIILFSSSSSNDEETSKSKFKGTNEYDEGVLRLSFLTNDPKVPRSVRNNNPGNITRGKFKPQGVIGRDEQFHRFESVVFGTRAMIDLLHRYFAAGRNTVNKIISRWAPPKSQGGDNPDHVTREYIAYVAQAIGVNKDASLSFDFNTIQKMVIAMTKQEGGKDKSKVDPQMFWYAWNLQNYIADSSVGGPPAPKGNDKPSSNSTELPINIPLLKLSNGKYVKASFLLDKNLVAAEDVQYYETPTSSKALGVIKKGNSIGTLYSYIDYTTHVWLVFGRPANNNRYLVFYRPTLLDLQPLKDQGTETIDEYQKRLEEAKKADAQSTSDKVIEGAGNLLEKYGKYALGLALLKIGIDAAMKSQNSKKDDA